MNWARITIAANAVDKTVKTALGGDLTELYRFFFSTRKFDNSYLATASENSTSVVLAQHTVDVLDGLDWLDRAIATLCPTDTLLDLWDSFDGDISTATQLPFSIFTKWTLSVSPNRATISCMYSTSRAIGIVSGVYASILKRYCLVRRTFCLRNLYFIYRSSERYFATSVSHNGEH